MSLKATMAQDYQTPDNTETVTYGTSRSGSPVTYTVHFADPRDVSFREAMSSPGYLVAGDRIWGLGAAEFPAGFVPQRGDTVTQQSGVVWYLKEGLELDELGIVWECPSSKGR